MPIHKPQAGRSRELAIVLIALVLTVIIGLAIRTGHIPAPTGPTVAAER